MTVDPRIVQLVEELAAIPQQENLFNPYQPLDNPASAQRRENLIRYLKALQQMPPRFFMLAEAPGYRGCRWTGIPITSERIIGEQRDKWGIFDERYHFTSDNPKGVAESSATILWNALNKLCDIPPVLWNTVPLHPHKPDNPNSNRTPTISEQRMGAAYIKPALRLFNVEGILAVGRTAQRMLAELDLPFTPLRHPSQGGKTEFVEGLRSAVR